jgi:hypothetical protein
MNTHVVKPHPARPHHATGEIVWATVGNYAEDRNCNAKGRPVVILRASDGQHWIAGLTTQPRFKTTGDARVLVPVHRTCRLCGHSYLWSPRPSRLCRLDVRSHIGWIGHEALDVIERHMHLSRDVLAELRAVADAQSNTDGEVPAATL